MFDNIQSKHDIWRDQALAWLSDIDGFKILILCGAGIALIGGIMMVPGFARLVGWAFAVIGGGLMATGIMLTIDPPKKG
jgi:hypothetical protein